MSNLLPGRDGGSIPNLEKPNLGMFVPGTGIPLFGGFAARATPRSAMDAQFVFTVKNRFTAPFTAAFDDALARLASASLRYIVPAIDRRLNSRQRRRLARALRRQLDADAHRILMTGRP